MKLSRLFVIFIALVAVLFSSCQNNTVFKHSIPIDVTGWTQDDLVKFSMDIDDTISWHNLVLKIEHSVEFPFQNLYVRVHTLQPEADSTAQPVSLELADRTGRWQGKCNGGNCVLDVMLQERFKFQSIGNYQIWVEQYMRDASISGIRKISLSLDGADQDF